MYLQATKQLARECEHKAVDAETNRNDSNRGEFIAGIISAKSREQLTLSLDAVYNTALPMELADARYHRKCLF